MSKATEYADRLERIADAATQGRWWVRTGDSAWYVEVPGETLVCDANCTMDSEQDRRNARHVAFNDPEAAKRHAAVIRALVLADKMLDHVGCPNGDCRDGAIPVPIGEHYVTREMAIDAGDESREGEVYEVEYGAEQCQWCAEHAEIKAALDALTEGESDDE